MQNELKVFAGNSNPALAAEICSHLGTEPGKLKILRFSNENIKVQIQENVRGADVFVIQTAGPPVNEHLMEMLILIDALKYASAGRITAVVPYYFYVRSDKKDEPRISITARLVADLLETAGANRILTMNLHSPQTMGFSRLPVDQLSAVSLICDYFKERENLSDFIAVAPDVGRAKTTEAYAQSLAMPMAILYKHRSGDDERANIRHLIGKVNDKNVLLLDDEILTGSSIIEGVKALRRHGAKRILAACIHGFLSGNAVQDIENSIVEKLLITNTLPLRENKEGGKIQVLSVAKLFADAVMAIHEGRSVSTLFEV